MPTQDVYDLIHEYCNLEAVKNLLRKYNKDVSKEKKSDVRVSGDNKAEIVGTNLRRAVEAKIIPKIEMYALLQDAEENGNQHVFYYRPRNKQVINACRDADSIAVKLWGNDWKTGMGFPRFRLVPEKYVWADFRVGVHGRPGDWIAKLYGHEKHMKFIREEDLGNDRLARYFERRDLRTVCLARWSSNNLLELRIPRSDCHKDQERRLAILWDSLRPALDQSQFTPWDLSNARLEMLRCAQSEQSVYETGDKEFIDCESVRTTIKLHTSTDEEDSPCTSKSTQKAVEAYVEGGESECDRIIIHWKPNKQNGLKRSMRTQVGTRDRTNEVVLFSQTSPQAVDYVTNQLRRFGE